jgi:predicted  nucleic acid-binding Zn-ribbon protein
MEQTSSIESRTRASFSRVKRDIDALKAQIAKLRERDAAFDHALSDYARSGELYEHIKRIDDRFAQLSDTFVTADEFEKGVARLVKETSILTKRFAALEKADLTPEVNSIRKELESLSTAQLPKKTFDIFVDKATSRIERIDTTLERVDERVKRIEALEKRLGAIEDMGSDAKRISEHERALKKLEGLDVKSVEKRLAELESAKLSEDQVRSITLDELGNAVRVEELNEKIDEFNTALDSTAERVRVEALEAAVTDLRSTVDKRSAPEGLSSITERLNDLEKRHTGEHDSTHKELVTATHEIDALSSRLAQFESLLAELRISVDEEVVSVSEFNEKIDEFNTALESAGDTDAIDKRLESERHATNALITSAIEQVEALSARVDEISDADPKIVERLEKIENRLDASGPNVFEGRLDVFEARLDSLESSSETDVTERIDDIEAQLKVVIDDMGESTDTRVVESLARDVVTLQKRVAELSEDVELTSKPERGPSLEHLQSEIEFLRTNVVMSEDLDSMRSELSAGKGGKKDNRVTVLSEDLQRLFERQSELEKKVLSLETQNRQLKSRESVEISEKVPLRDPKPQTEPKVSKEPAKPSKPAQVEPAASEDEQNDGALGRVRRWMVDFFTEEVEEPKPKKPKGGRPKDELY